MMNPIPTAGKSRNWNNFIISLTAAAIVIVASSYLVSGEAAPCQTYACPRPLCDLKQKGVQNFCENVKCVGISVGNCSGDGAGHGGGRIMYEEHLSMCGCCPGCVKYLGLGEPCEQHPPEPTPDPFCSEQFCPLLMHRCAPGLVCPLVGPSEKRCSFKGAGGGSFTELTSCHDKRALAYTNDLYWTPECDAQGFYSPKQCKGRGADGICFCVNRDGKRIFGVEYASKAENQTCECSRQVEELREAGHIVSLHCSPDGGYEALQCDTESRLCYCVDPKTGKLTGAVGPENQWKSLPCFSQNLTNFDPKGGYYRACDSEWALAQKLSQEASLHGLQVLSGRRISCDYDGSFAPVQNIEGRTKCVQKNNVLIGAYFATEDLFDTDCQCVRDEIKVLQDGRQFLKKCEAMTGNYDLISPDPTNPRNWQCVDRDGMFFGEVVDERYKCCLFGSLPDPRNCSKEPEAVKQQCYDPNAADNTGKYKPCSYWPQ